MGFSSGGVLDKIADKYTDVIEFQTSLGLYIMSKKLAGLILKEEGCMASHYVPENRNSSGVTLGYGFDLGQQTIATMRATISDFYT